MTIEVAKAFYSHPISCIPEHANNDHLNMYNYHFLRIRRRAYSIFNADVLGVEIRISEARLYAQCPILTKLMLMCIVMIVCDHQDTMQGCWKSIN